MSRAVHRLLGDEVIEGVTFGELGEHRLRGIPSPELLFEIIVAEMAEAAAAKA